MLHGALPRRYDLFTVPGQLAFLQKSLLRFVFVIVHGLDAERARLERVIVFSARVKQLFLRGVPLIGALFQAAAEVLVDNIRPLQAVKLLLIPGNAGVFPVFGRKLRLDTVPHMGQLPVMIRQHLIVQPVNTILKMADLIMFFVFFPVQHYDLSPQRGNRAALFVQPQEIQLGKMLVDGGHLIGDLHTPQVCGLLFRHGALNEEMRKQRILCLRQKLTDGGPVLQLIFDLFQLALQSGNAQVHCPAADECVVHPFPPHGAGHIALIEHAVRGNGRLETAQLVGSVAAHHASQQVIHIAARQRVLRLHFLRKAVVPGSDGLPFTELTDIHQSEGRRAEISFDPVKNRQRSLVVGRIDQ